MASAASLSSSMAALRVSPSAGSSLFGAAVAAKPQVACPSASPSTIRMAIKRWERKETKPNGKPVLQKLHVRVGDTVQVIAGKDKGKVTEVVRVITHNAHVLCRDINIKTKHVKGKAEGEQGQIIQIEAPIHSSNVMLYSKKEKVASRVGHTALEDGTKVRVLLKTGEVIDQPWKRVAKKEKKDTKPSTDGESS
eukprot:TRINITY_DN78970_c0_g1_i1.p1 TRINITY_DN78970_c0_g1~~TRINITY_DN78970_c0_g1_i1.p1  ORF type:complete len:194 (-),score=26.86 TRINITY_DN78970_c0_g1_i1:244-825(-)